MPWQTDLTLATALRSALDEQARRLNNAVLGNVPISVEDAWKRFLDGGAGYPGRSVLDSLSQTYGPLYYAAPPDVAWLNVMTPAFNPIQLFANGEKGWWYDVADLDTQFTDIAGTTRVQNTGDAVARINDKSPSGSNAIKATASARPALKFLPASNRPYHDYDGVDDVLTNSTVDLGSNCTVIRIFAGGPNIQTGQTIGAGNSNRTLDNFGEIVVNRALTAAETAAVTLWCQQRAGNTDELNVVYGADATNEVMDVYHSSGSPDRPIIIMTHGGGWRNGDKLLANVIQNKFQHWIPKGFTCVSVNYKLDVGTDPVTVQAVSIAKAIAYVQAHAIGWGCNPNNIIIMGHSAGAHLTNMVASSASIRLAAGVRPWLATILLDSAAYDVVNIMSTTHLPLYDEPWSGGMSQWTAGSPALIMTGRIPPTLCVVSQTGNPHSEDDAANTDEWINAARAFGTVVVRRDTPLDHGDLNNFLGLPASNSNLALDPTYTADVDAYILGLGIHFAT